MLKHCASVCTQGLQRFIHEAEEGLYCTLDCLVIIFPLVSLCLGNVLNQTYLNCYYCLIYSLVPGFV